METATAANQLLNTYNPLEGNARAAKLFRAVLGFGETHSLAAVCLDYNELSIATVSMLEQRLEKSTYDQECKFIQTLIDMTKKGFLTNIAELGYYVSTRDNSYTYVGFFLPVDNIDTMKEHADGNEDVHVYMCDSEKEQEMWNREKADPQRLTNRTKRKPHVVARDLDVDYINVMLLRYAHDDLEKLPLAAINDISAKYIWVQIRARVPGERVYTVTAFLRGLLETIKTGTR